MVPTNDELLYLDLNHFSFELPSFDVGFSSNDDDDFVEVLPRSTVQKPPSSSMPKFNLNKSNQPWFKDDMDRLNSMANN